MPDRIFPGSWSAGRRGLAAALVALLLVLANDVFIASERGFLHAREGLFGAFEPPLAGDHFRYIELAKAPEERAEDDRWREAPWRYRILTPTLVRIVASTGLGIDAAFYLVTQIGLVLFLLTTFLWLRARGFDERFALLGIALVALLPGAVRWYAFQYWMTDPLSLFLITAALYAVDTRRYRLLLAVSVVGVLNRESQWIVFPYLLLRCAASDGFAPALKRTLALMAAPLAVWLALRLLVDAEPAAGLLANAQSILHWRSIDPGHHLYFATIGSFGVLVALLLLPPWRGRRISRALPELVLIAQVYASLLLGNNTSRLLAYALPALLPLALGQLRAFLRLAPLTFTYVALAALYVQLILYLRTVVEVAAVQPFDPVTAGAVGLFWAGGVAVFAVELREKRSRGLGPRI